VFDEHGETPLLPWSYQVVEDEPQSVTIQLSTRTLRLPLYIEKTISLREEPVLFIKESVTNMGLEPIAVMWGHHPALGAPFVDSGCFIDVPECRCVSHPIERFPTQRLVPDQSFTWPIAPGRDGSTVDFSRVQPPGAGTADLVYLTDLPEGWYAVTNPSLKVSFGMAWTVETFKHLWLWHDANGSAGYPWYSKGYVLALEPWSSYPSMGLAEAVSRNTHIILQPGETRNASLTAVVSIGAQRVRQVTLDGLVKT
jgi:galactose mutarotase-like enzyme